LEIVADLHIHSNYSDGSHSIDCIIKKAIQKKLNVISLTDHDTIDGVDEAIKIGTANGITVISGVEISSEIEDQEIHILGYFIDIKSDDLRFYLSQFKKERQERAERILKNLKAQGVDLTIEDVLQFSESKPITRPHIAAALIKKRIVGSYYEAFYKFLGDYSSAYEKKKHSSLNVVIELIKSCGGIPVLAHPYNLSDGKLNQIINSGIMGIEIEHPTIKRNLKTHLKKLMISNSLIETGGSDFHGGLRKDDTNFGKFGLSNEQVKNLFNFIQKRKM